MRIIHRRTVCSVRTSDTGTQVGIDCDFDFGSAFISGVFEVPFSGIAEGEPNIIVVEVRRK